MRVKAFFLVVAATSLVECKQYRSDYEDYPDAGGWLKLHRVPANCHEARLRCHLEGGTLASPLTQKMSDVLKSFVEDHELGSRGIFTGIRATFSRGDFASIEGVPLARIPHRWASGEPDNKQDSEQCILQLKDGSLADVSCNDTYPYICYRKYTNQLTNACGTFDNEYQLDARTGNCYKFHLVPRTWSRAYMACTAEGGHLAIINSDTEAKVLADLFAKYQPSSMQSRSPYSGTMVFIGFHDWNEHGEWLTVQGQTLQQAGYARWSHGQPTSVPYKDHPVEYCGGIQRSAGLDDLWCDMPYHFICEKTPDSLLWDEQ
ncbi:CD209 antigen-like protein B isoform X1 [Cydia pomonella]|uniref:CD209 antigen-like protein B isoform X1 n=1 Tax=Cydia pomonella TaxID=82600 RepID=UPI002ADE5077|nr:CD209 antigen-like protein B isoform X1 [Cydia pomonella]XP_061713802.1 CD209 antigen-like protein B isoform X1 [Cydia pomonella]XP_061713803.1 CD209 antigen-like protein B isoform X1 [Cydia pomonella]